MTLRHPTPNPTFLSLVHATLRTKPDVEQDQILPREKRHAAGHVRLLRGGARARNAAPHTQNTATDKVEQSIATGSFSGHRPPPPPPPPLKGVAMPIRPPQPREKRPAFVLEQWGGAVFHWPPFLYNLRRWSASSAGVNFQPAPALKCPFKSVPLRLNLI